MLLALVMLCSSDGYNEDSVVENDISTFGIRHDKSLSDYEEVAASEEADRPNFKAVVNFTYSLDGSDNQDLIATGTLIDPEWILTAGHNFFESDEQTEPALVSGITVKVGNDPNNPDATYDVEEIIIHPT